MTKRDWWKDAEEDVIAETATARALDRSLDRRNREAKARVTRITSPAPKSKHAPTKLERMHPIAHYAAMIGTFHHETWRCWCRDGVIRAHLVGGNWLIPESAVIEFLEGRRVS
jgi:hypothetical protein